MIIGNDSNPVKEDEFLQAGQPLLQYLLDQGADPSIYLEGSEYDRSDPLTITQYRLSFLFSLICHRPAILAAFEYSYTAAVTSLVCHGADLHDFWSRLAGMWHDQINPEAFVWKVRLLRSANYSDWHTTEPVENLLCGSCWHRHMELTLFALEVAQIDPNLTTPQGIGPMNNAARIGWLEGVAVLVEAGARPNATGKCGWLGPPLNRSLATFRNWNLLRDASHYLLLHGADPTLLDFRGYSTWVWLCEYLGPWWDVTWEDNVSFVHFEGSLAHLLHHDADPFAVFFTTNRMTPWNQQLPMRWFDKIGYVRASDMARFWSHGIEEQFDDNPIPNRATRDPNLVNWQQELEIAERTQNLEWTFQWDHLGRIIRLSSGYFVEDTDSEASTSVYSDDAGRYKSRAERDDDFENYIAVKENGFEIESSDVTEGDDSISDEGIPAFSEPEFEGIAPDFFRNATAFYRHISNEQGCRQLSRFPMVRALCDALQHAGYRAEMDDDGDIWYDCDDGDRYFDAWEAPIEEDDPAVWLPKVCPICQDFPGYGLGHVLERAERAKQQYHEYKEQVRQGKRALYI